jgi:hypothetical protein
METPTDPATGTIIKSDRTGRTRYTAQYKGLTSKSTQP